MESFTVEGRKSKGLKIEKLIEQEKKGSIGCKEYRTCLGQRKWKFYIGPRLQPSRTGGDGESGFGDSSFHLSFCVIVLYKNWSERGE